MKIVYDPSLDPIINDLLPRPLGDIDQYDTLSPVINLPNVTEIEVATTIIKTILGWSMLLVIIAIVIAGIKYIISQGKDEDITKSKNIIIYLIIGLAIMAAAYGIVTGISQFDFFQAS